MPEIAAGWADALQHYVEGLMVESLAAAQEATRYFHRSVVHRASQSEGWSNLADDISVWSQDGNLVIGFISTELASQAEVLEFGDLNTPPNPLFRTLTNEGAEANAQAVGHMRRKFPAMRQEVNMDIGAPVIKGMRYGH